MALREALGSVCGTPTSVPELRVSMSPSLLWAVLCWWRQWPELEPWVPSTDHIEMLGETAGTGNFVPFSQPCG